MMKKSTRHLAQLYCIALILSLCAACNGKKDEAPAIPPPTSPLSQTYIGYGVVNVSYTRVNSAPDDDSDSPGYLRRGAVVRIVERRLLRSDEKSESWLFVEGTFSGWLRESLVDIYDNGPQAETASKALGS